MSGRLKKAVPAADGAHQRLARVSLRENSSPLPKRRRPRAHRGVEHRVALLPGRSRRPRRVWNSCTAAPATSSAMKCGTSHITGASLRSASVHVAFDVDQPPQPLAATRTRAGRARRMLRPSQRKCSRSQRSRAAARPARAGTARGCARAMRRRARGHGVQQRAERAAERRLQRPAAASAAATATPAARVRPAADQRRAPRRSGSAARRGAL